jgi:2-C-methyl-D-erythritol 2,4-cyclodiphosphate synthase
MFRIGQGYDVHRFSPHRPLILGGVEIPDEQGLDGHSDADVLLHAVIDALLGAAALGDIGKHFPDTSSCFKDADSRLLLRHTRCLVDRAGFTIANIDSTIIAQKPKLATYIPAMCAHMAVDLALSLNNVNVKAKTNENLGFLGRAEGIAAMAIVLLIPS